MQSMMNLDLWTGFALVGVGVALASVILIPLTYYVRKRAVMNLRVDLMQRLPLTLEQIEADKELLRAHHVIELKRLELKIAEIQAAEAEANAAAAEGLSRIDKLNRRIEVLQLKLAARSKTKDIRRVDEKLIMLDSAKNQLDENAA